MRLRPINLRRRQAPYPSLDAAGRARFVRNRVLAVQSGTVGHSARGCRSSLPPPTNQTITALPYRRARQKTKCTWSHGQRFNSKARFSSTAPAHTGRTHQVQRRLSLALLVPLSRERMVRESTREMERVARVAGRPECEFRN